MLQLNCICYFFIKNETLAGCCLSNEEALFSELQKHTQWFLVYGIVFSSAWGQTGVQDLGEVKWWSDPCASKIIFSELSTYRLCRSSPNSQNTKSIILLIHSLFLIFFEVVVMWKAWSSELFYKSRMPTMDMNRVFFFSLFYPSLKDMIEKLSFVCKIEVSRFLMNRESCLIKILQLCFFDHSDIMLQVFIKFWITLWNFDVMRHH